MCAMCAKARLWSQHRGEEATDPTRWGLVPCSTGLKASLLQRFFARYVKKNESCKKTEIYRWLKIIDRNILNNKKYYCIIQTSCNYSPISIRIPENYLIEIMTLLYLCNIISDHLSKRNNILIWVLHMYLFGGYTIYTCVIYVYMIYIYMIYIYIYDIYIYDIYIYMYHKYNIYIYISYNTYIYILCTYMYICIIYIYIYHIYT